MKIVCILFRLSCWLGALLLTLLTLAVSAINMAMVTQYWWLIVLGGTGLLLVIALLAGVLTRLIQKAMAWKTVKTLLVLACVFLAQVPLHFLFNTSCSLAVKAHVHMQVAQLEAYHKEQGRYPGTLEDVEKDNGVVAKLISQWSSYSVYNERSSYRLTVQRPMGAGQYVYDPVSEGWK